MEVAVLLIVIKPLFHSLKSTPFFNWNFFIDEWLIYKFMLFQSPLFKNYRILRVDNHWFDLMWRFKSFLIDLCRLLPNNVNRWHMKIWLNHSILIFKIPDFVWIIVDTDRLKMNLRGGGKGLKIYLYAQLHAPDKYIPFWPMKF